MSGSQPGSGSVVILPSVSASRMAVIGRQKEKDVRQLQVVDGQLGQPFSTMDSSCCSDSVRKMRLHVAGGFSAQYRAAFV